MCYALLSRFAVFIVSRYFLKNGNVVYPYNASIVINKPSKDLTLLNLLNRINRDGDCPTHQSTKIAAWDFFHYVESLFAVCFLLDFCELLSLFQQVNADLSCPQIFSSYCNDVLPYVWLVNIAKSCKSTVPVSVKIY